MNKRLISIMLPCHDITKYLFFQLVLLKHVNITTIVLVFIFLGNRAAPCCYCRSIWKQASLCKRICIHRET